MFSIPPQVLLGFDAGGTSLVAMPDYPSSHLSPFGIDAVPAISCLGMCGSSTKNLKKQLGQHNCWIGHGG